MSNGSLVIRNVAEVDVGIYTCVGIRFATNDLSQSYAAELNIACKRT